MPLLNSIAIDGPAASGKSTLAKRLADALDYLFFDTGVMYRAVTYAVLAQGGDAGDEALCTRVAEGLDIDVQPASQTDGRQADVLIDGRDCTWEIRQPQVDASVSIVAAYPGVRQALTGPQRRIGLRGRVVMVGRDIGTVVLPEADLKIYLDASVAERARRRFEERRRSGKPEEFERLLDSIRQRDRLDASRDLAPLRPAEDAVIVDSDGKNADEVFAEMLALVEARQDAG
ncbi:MAG: (d)CMP kinase [Chloroflexi bacterium]|nr:(d)CMP kinase [Chloroflexota bacterium]